MNSFSFLCLVLTVTTFSFSVSSYKITEKADYPYVSREDWGAREATDVRPLHTPVPYVVIHHTYIPGACYTEESCKQSMRGMQNYHMGQGWGDIGYNFCVGTEGSAYEGRGWNVVGIHAGPANNFSIGICLIGDWRVEVPPKKTLATTKALISDGVAKGAISPEYKLIGHNQAMATECPGDALLKVISTWKQYVPGHIDFTIPESTGAVPPIQFSSKN